MAKARVKMTCADCGTEYWAEKDCYNRSEANRWEEWMQGQEGCCPACYAKRKAAERAAKNEAENAKAAEQSAVIGLQGLTGTERRVAWATTIRLDALYRALGALTGRTAEELNSAGIEVVRAAIAAMPTDAQWWIDHKDDASHLVGEEIECANWARLDDARREAKLAKVRADIDRNLPGVVGACARDALIRHERYERARLAGRGSLEQRRADEEAKRAALPPVPAKLAERLGKPGAKWNGKFYGCDGLRVYLDGQECAVPAEVKTAWDAEWTAYRAAKAAAGIK